MRRFGFSAAILVAALVVTYLPYSVLPRPQLKPRQAGEGPGNRASPQCFADPPGGQVILVPNATIGEYLLNASDHSILRSLLNATNTLNATFAHDANITVFAPTDTAFSTLPGWVQQRFRSPLALPVVVSDLYYHIHPGADVCTSNFTMQGGAPNTTIPPTSLGTLNPFFNLTLYRNASGTYFANDAAVIHVVNATNGLIYGVNRVLTPLYYLNTTIYNLVQEPAPLPSNYTLPFVPASSGDSGSRSSGGGTTAAAKLLRKRAIRKWQLRQFAEMLGFLGQF
ncbi:hypothetical protein HK102_012995 [Quaeritorhiza haematococci]|nr:hypothetical protein HK102_012995 [Quaeritorhiza haematococci]